MDQRAKDALSETQDVLEGLAQFLTKVAAEQNGYSQVSILAVADSLKDVKTCISDLNSVPKRPVRNAAMGFQVCQRC